jgi:diadenosine tetraphosphate (Ap4A) HIT family hydrolase
MDFEIHKNFVSKIFLVDLPLCRVLLENERHYPWILLVPRRHNKLKMMDLSQEDQRQLLGEMDLVQKVLWNEFSPSQLNVAAIGNKTPQLHIHIIARFQDDPAWPGTVWDHSVRAAYPADQLDQMQVLLQQRLMAVVG